ncbi:MAG: hypothetical protein J6Y94_05585 [Bacteriovoracaceae bacterium]|nr:hypothetical protein [Bacteriovoracaceae bacterium]
MPKILTSFQENIKYAFVTYKTEKKANLKCSKTKVLGGSWVKCLHQDWWWLELSVRFNL